MKCSFADSEWRIKAAGWAIIIHRKTRQQNAVEFLLKAINKSWRGLFFEGHKVVSFFFPFFGGFSDGWPAEGVNHRARSLVPRRDRNRVQKEQSEARAATMAAHGNPPHVPQNVWKPNFKFIGGSSLGIWFIIIILFLNPLGDFRLSAIHKTGWIVINKEPRCSPDLRIPEERPRPIGKTIEKNVRNILERCLFTLRGWRLRGPPTESVTFFHFQPWVYFTEMQSLFGEAYFNILWSHSIPLEVTCPTP